MKKPIRLSNLAMRFYLRDGWTRDELASLIVKGKLHDPFPQDKEDGYFILEVGGAFDVKKLAERISEVRHTFNDHKGESIEEIIEHFNW